MAMLLQNTQADGFSGVENGSTGHGASNWRRQRNNRSNVPGPLARHRARNHSSQTMTDQVNFSPCLRPGFFYGLIQMALDEDVRAISVDPDARKIWPVSDAPQPTVELHQIKVGAKKTWNDDDPRVIPMRHAKAVVNGSCVQQENLSREERFRPR